ncbi:MAG: dihydroorotate dehydrogenase electron transfer subunit [Lachnospiraceae bacterium]|nr:dihydroorotate dehydrogenase electron transfer subunit [Lachnospiraceae bacterium]
MKKKETAKILSQEMLAENIYSMWIETDISGEAAPGRFISVYTKDRSKLLPRPVSICDAKPGKLRIVYRIQGEGTREFSTYREGDDINILGPLGNGFPLECSDEGKRILLIGGGIGIPPLLFLAKRLKGKETVIAAGYRDKSLFLDRELAENGKMLVATEDGSIGTKGTVIDAIRAYGVRADIIYSCGPLPMLRAVKEYAVSEGIKAYVSMEERMACSVGACLGCVCGTVETDDHSKVKNRRVCKDGPVFDASEVIL